MMNCKTYHYVLVAFLFVSAWQLHAQVSSPGKEKKELKIIEDKNNAYELGIANHDLNLFTAQYATDCWIMVPQLPIHCGPQASADFFKLILQKESSSGKRIIIDLYGVSDEMLAEVGFYQFYDNAGALLEDGKYIVLWKNINGDWKRYRESLSSSR